MLLYKHREREREESEEKRREEKRREVRQRERDCENINYFDHVQYTVFTPKRKKSIVSEADFEKVEKRGIGSL